MGMLLFTILLPAVAVIGLAVIDVRAVRRARRLRSLPPIDKAESVVEVIERVIEHARVSGQPLQRGYALGALQGLHESGQLDDEDYMRLSAGVVDWMVDAHGIGVTSRLRRRRWALRA